jgi:hypothetical protein
MGRAQVAYTPQLSYQSSCTLIRIAWALGIPMTKAIERVFEHLPVILDNEKVCHGCRDKTGCDDCAFNSQL